MFAALKNNTIVRIVSERSLDNTYTIMADVTAPYNLNDAAIISQDEVLEIDSNIAMLYRRVSKK